MSYGEEFAEQTSPVWGDGFTFVLVFAILNMFVEEFTYEKNKSKREKPIWEKTAKKQVYFRVLFLRR